jgi:selenocysteine-specific elongation factor
MATGLVFERDGRHFATSAVHRGSRIVGDLLRESPEGVTMSAIREALGTTRKYALPFVALLDAEGITRRRGDLRVAGPRLHSASVPEATGGPTMGASTGGDRVGG